MGGRQSIDLFLLELKSNFLLEVHFYYFCVFSLGKLLFWTTTPRCLQLVRGLGGWELQSKKVTFPSSISVSVLIF